MLMRRREALLRLGNNFEGQARLRLGNNYPPSFVNQPRQRSGKFGGQDGGQVCDYNGVKNAESLLIETR